MNITHGLAALALAAMLNACSPAPQTEVDETSFRKETPAQAAAASEETLPPVLDAQGNELDPELAEAVRAKMEEDKAALESGESAASAPTDDGAVAADDET